MTKTPIDDPIASLELLWLRKDGSETFITAKIGRPYKIDDDKWRCPCELLGVDSKYPDLLGMGSIQALGLALSLVKTRLGHLVEGGEKICFPGERETMLDHAYLNATFGK
jgi:hypothetical protein